MAKMTAIEAAVRVLESEGVTSRSACPAPRSFRSTTRSRKSRIRHILARHEEGATHMAEGYTRAKTGNIGVCIGTSGPAGTDMITGLYSASADTIPILCITGQAPRAKLYKEDFQAVDIEAITKPVTKWSVTVREPALVPSVFQQAFHVMRSGRPGPVLIDLPIDVQIGRDRVSTPRPTSPCRSTSRRASRGRRERALDDAERGRAAADRRRRRHHQRRRRPTSWSSSPSSPASRSIPTLMGWGCDPRRPSADGRNGRPADQPPLRQRHLPRIGLRARHRQPLGQPPHRLDRGLHARAASSSMSTSSRRRSAGCSAPTSASSPTRARRSSSSSRSREE